MSLSALSIHLCPGSKNIRHLYAGVSVKTPPSIQSSYQKHPGFRPVDHRSGDARGQGLLTGPCWSIDPSSWIQCHYKCDMLIVFEDVWGESRCRLSLEVNRAGLSMRVTLPKLIACIAGPWSCTDPLTEKSARIFRVHETKSIG